MAFMNYNRELGPEWLNQQMGQAAQTGQRAGQVISDSLSGLVPSINAAQQNAQKQKAIKLFAKGREEDMPKVEGGLALGGDLPTALGLRSERLRGGQAILKQSKIREAMAAYEQAVNDFNTDPTNTDKQTQVRLAMGNLRALGVTVSDPIDDYANKQRNEAMLGLSQQRVGLQESGQQFQQEMAQQQLDLGQQRLAQDSYFRQQQLDLQKDKAAQAERKAMQLKPEEAQKLGQLQKAEPVLQRLEKAIASDFMMNQKVNAINSSNELTRQVANKVSDPDTQLFALAKQTVRNMVGRDLSGAAIASHEWAAFEANIPQYGDTPEVLEAKRQYRKAWIDDKLNRGKNLGGGDNAPAPVKQPSGPREVW